MESLEILQESHLGVEKFDNRGCVFNICQDGHPLSLLTTDKDLFQPYILAGRQCEVQNESQDTSIESFEGSPLKLQKILNEKDGKTVVASAIKPLSLQQARLILSKICLKSKDLSYPLWLMCHGKQHNSQILYMGIQPRTLDNQLLIHSYKISMEESFSQNSKLQSLQSYLNDNCHIDSFKCVSEYDIFSSNNKDGADQCSLLIRYCWSHVTSLMQPPPHSAKASLNVKIGIGNSCSPVYEIFKELDLLRSFGKSLKDGCIEWSVEENTLPVMDRVNQLVEETQEGIPARKVTNNEDEESSPVKTLTARYTEREDLDFTEQLWIILKTCKSSTELKSCLQYVLQLIQAGTLQPRVHRSNHSSLAKLIRDSYKNCMVMPSLEDIQPLTFLVDIGIDKVRRTYEDIFKGKELVTGGHLDYYALSGCNIEEKLERITKLHYTLELMAMLEKSINPPIQVLGSAVRQALKYYESKGVTEDHTFCIPVKVEHVIDITARLPVLSWKAETKHKEHGNDVTNIFCVTPQPVYDHAEIEIKEESSNENDYTYYLTVYKETITAL